MSDDQVDPGEAADALRRVLDAVRRGELDAGSGMVARLEGALDALDAIARLPTRRPEKRNPDLRRSASI